MPKESFTVVFNVQGHNSEPSAPAGTKVLTEAESLPPKTLVSGITATIFETQLVTIEAGTAAEALKAVRQIYKLDSGVGFAVKTSAVTYESI